MAVVVLTDMDIFVGSLDQSCFASEATLTLDAAEADATTFCSGGFRRLIGGIKSSGLSVTGPQDFRIESSSAVSSLTYSAGIGTLTTSSGHSFGVGDVVTLSGFTPSGWDGDHVVLTVPSATTLTFMAPSTLANATTQGRAYKLAGPDAQYGLSVGSTYAVSMTPVGGVEGSASYLAQMMLQSVSPLSGQVGELVTHQAQFRGLGQVVRGVLGLSATVTASGAAAAGFQLGSVAASQRIWCAAHVLAMSGTSPSVQVAIQSDDNSGFTTPTAQLSPSSFTAAGSVVASAQGAITDTWWRVSYTVSGTSPRALVRVAMGIG